MKRLGVANTKGGVGKTTIAVTLATLAADAGRRVFLVDADAQHSASGLAEDYGEDAPFDFAVEDNPRKLSRIRGDTYDLVVVDLPGAREGGQLRSVLEGTGGTPAVDALLMPTLLEALDLRALRRALRDEVTPAGIPYAAVITRVNPHPVSIAAAQDRAGQLRAAGVRVLTPLIRRYAAHSDAQWAGAPLTRWGGRHSLARRAEADMRAVAAAALGSELLKRRWAKSLAAEEEVSTHG